MAQDRAIGRHNQLPWYLPDDLKYFKRVTLGKPVLMGRKTYEALGKPLPGRQNIVVSSHAAPMFPNEVSVAVHPEAGICAMETTGAAEGFIIGGGQLFAATMPRIDRLYITLVDTKIPDADTFFPIIEHTHWLLTSETEHPADARHAHAFKFQIFERIGL